MPETPDCFRCSNFYITHEPSHSYGCKAMGFKSARLPSVVVSENSGIACQAFTARDKSSRRN